MFSALVSVRKLHRLTAGPDLKKPYSAVTVQIDLLTGETYEVDDSSGIVDLVEAIRIQNTGPYEASRALRKKLSVIRITAHLPLYKTLTLLQ